MKMALSVKAGLVPAIHVTTPHRAAEAPESQASRRTRLPSDDVDGRDEPGHGGSADL
jgi:hypothetical protein